MTACRLILFAVVAACSAKQARTEKVVAGSATETVPADAESEPEPEATSTIEADDPPDHPWGGDSLARLPKVDFVAPYHRTSDAAKTKQASTLHAEGVARHTAKDWRGAEQKYKAVLAIDPGHVGARYGLAAALVRLGSADRAIALLVELGRIGCGECVAAVNRARWDDDFESLWDRVVFGRIGYRAQDRNWASEEMTCAAGLEPQADHLGFACLRNGQLHGRYFRTGFGSDWGGHGGSEEFGEYRDGKKHGLWTLRHSNGATQVSSLEFGAYVDDVKHGLWVETGDSRAGGGTVLAKWVRGKREGVSRTRTHHRGIESESDPSIEPTEGPLEETTFANDVPDGPTKEWAGGRLIREGAHRNGKQHGRWIEHGTDKPISETEYLDGAKHGAWILRTDKGETKYTGSWDRGRPVGDHAYWHEAKLVGKATIRNFTGDWVAYSDNLRVEKGRLVDGKRDGRWRFWAGGEWHEGSYAAGRRTGKWTLTDREGTRQSEGPYADDKRQGAWTFWRDRKTLRAKGRFAGDVVDGAWTIFDDSGVVAQKLLFRAGKLVEVDGEPATEVHLSNYLAGPFSERPDKISSEPSPFGDFPP